MADPVWESLRKKRVAYRQYKAGGRVAGEKSPTRLDKMSRAKEMSKDANGRSSEDEVMSLGRSQREETTDWDYKKGGRVPKKDFKPGGKKGKLHREMGIPEGEKIPATKLKAAAHSSDPEKRRDAIRAETMKKWHHGKK